MSFAVPWIEYLRKKGEKPCHISLQGRQYLFDEYGREVYVSTSKFINYEVQVHCNPPIEEIRGEISIKPVEVTDVSLRTKKGSYDIHKDRKINVSSGYEAGEKIIDDEEMKKMRKAARKLGYKLDTT